LGGRCGETGGLTGARPERVAKSALGLASGEDACGNVQACRMVRFVGRTEKYGR